MVSMRLAGAPRYAVVVLMGSLAGPWASCVLASGDSGVSGSWQPASAIASSPAMLDDAAGPGSVAVDLDQATRRSNAPTAFTLGFRPFETVDDRGWSDRAWGRSLGAMSSAVTLRGPTEAPPGTRNFRRSNPIDHFGAEVKVPLAGAGAIGGDRRPSSTAPTPVALDLAADTYETGFGRDLYSATMIADGIHGSPWIANGGVRAEERIRRRRDWELKLAAGTRVRWCPPLGAHPITATFGGGELLRNHGRRSVVLASTELDVPVHSALGLTGSLTCSNRPERFREGLVRGVIGLSYQPSSGR
jgi:hypothetical protein